LTNFESAGQRDRDLVCLRTELDLAIEHRGGAQALSFLRIAPASLCTTPPGSAPSECASASPATTASGATPFFMERRRTDDL
jgi:hypothetical protein